MDIENNANNMEQTRERKWNQGHIPIYFILIILFLITSCKGQESDNLRVIKMDPSTCEESNVTTPRKDPLFFIDGQLCQHVREIFQDKSGNLWFGTNVYDMMFYNGDTLRYFSKEDGLEGGRITGIVEDREGNVWFANYGNLTKYDGKTFTNYAEKENLLYNEIWSLLLDRNGIFWAGTSTGVSRFDGKEFTPFPIPKGQVKDTIAVFGEDRVTNIIEDKEGNLWFGMDGFGLCKYDGETFTNFTKKNGLPGNAICDLMEDSKGNIWIGTYYGGVSMYDGNTFSNFTQDGVVGGVEVGGFYEDKNGNIWFAVENNGVYRYDGQSFTNFYKEEGLVTNGILSILEDREGRFWFGGWGGLFRFDGKSFTSVTKVGPWEK